MFTSSRWEDNVLAIAPYAVATIGLILTTGWFRYLFANGKDASHLDLIDTAYLSSLGQTMLLFQKSDNSRWYYSRAQKVCQMLKEIGEGTTPRTNITDKERYLYNRLLTHSAYEVVLAAIDAAPVLGDSQTLAELEWLEANRV